MPTKIAIPTAVQSAVGFTEELVARLRELQGGKCAACGVVTTTGCGTDGEVADHDHYTGEPRGLLCNCCNRLVGKYEQVELVDPSLIERCRRYLANPPVRRLGLLALALSALLLILPQRPTPRPVPAAEASR